MIGTTLDGRYRILNKLGEGGMGEVYLAEHVNLGRREALKILRPSLADDPEFVARFRREARATNRVQHQNIVGVYDFGRLPDGRFYLSMEYAEGEGLDALIRRLGPLPMPRVLSILCQLAEAVHHAHARGVVHRDLKPENLVLVEHRGQSDFLKILDFGIAKIVAPDHAESMALSDKGHVYGTPSYMSPEQAAGVGTDPRSDIYAIGCIAFDLLVGEPPFLGRSAVEIMHLHHTRAPERPGLRRPQASIPAELDAIVLRCLEKAPLRRFQTGEELLVALRRVPGYRSRKSPTGRRGGIAHILPPTDYAAPLDTQESPHTHPALSDETSEDLAQLAHAQTDPIDPDQALDDLRGALRETAETLIDAGLSDIQLIVGAAQLKNLDDKLRGEEGEMDSLEQKLADLEQAGREREGALRFALGELRFVRSQAVIAGDTVLEDVEFQIRELERRVVEVHGELEQAQTTVLDRLIALTASRDTTLEQLAPMYDALERLVLEVLPRYLEHPRVEPLVARFLRARERRRRSLD